VLILYLIDLVGNRPIHYKNLLLLVICSIVRLWSWTVCWHFFWRFPRSS